MPSAKVRIQEDWDAVAAMWTIGQPVRAAGSTVIIGHVIATGTDDAGVYAEIELTPAALGVGYERPTEGEEEDPFG